MMTVIRVGSYCLRKQFSKRNLKELGIEVKSDFWHPGLRKLILPDNMELQYLGYDIYSLKDALGKSIFNVVRPYDKKGGYIMDV